MNFDLTEDQALLKAAVERFVADCYGGDLAARRAARITPAGFSRANWQRLAETGVLALPVSAANGGLCSENGAGRVDLATVMEALGRGLVAEPVLEATIAAALLDAAGNAAQHKAYLAPLLAGDTLTVLAHAERDARYNLAHVGTTARPRGDHVSLDGSKVAVGAGGAADHFIVSARGAGGVRDADGIGFWLVAATTPGVDRRAYRLADGSVAAEIMLRGVEVGRDAQLAGGLETLLPIIATARLAAAAEMLGAMTLLFDTTLAYVKTRSQFGQPLGSFQVIQHRMTDAYVLVEQARSHVVRAMLAPPADLDRAAAGDAFFRAAAGDAFFRAAAGDAFFRAAAGDAFFRAAAGAMAFVAEAALTVAHTAVQMHGGMGVTDELGVGHALKRIRVLALTFGDATAALDDYRRAA
jgi:alkylation response protein AidB-like acyl-CoA dehydrogenase